MVLWIIAGVVIGLIVYWHINSPRNAPGPSPTVFLGNLNLHWSLAQGSYPAYAEMLCNAHGKIVQCYLPGLFQSKSLFTIADPKLVTSILCDKKTFPYRVNDDSVFSKVAPQSLLILPSGDKYFRHKSIIMPFLHQKHHLTNYMNVIKEKTKQLVDLLTKKDEVDINVLLTTVSGDIICQIAFGSQRDLLGELQCDPLVEKVKYLCKDAMWLSVLPFLSNFSGGRKQRLAESVSCIRERALGLINSKKDNQNSEQNNASPTILQMLKDYKSDLGESLSYNEIIDEVATMFLAGHDTIANTVSWSLLMLSRNPHIQKRLFNEVSTQIPNFPSDYDEFDTLKYCQAVIYETLRICPTVPVMLRTSVEDYQWDNIKFPRDSSFAIVCNVMNQNEDIWTNPKVFDPARFYDISSIELARMRKDKGFFPFGAGTRICIGKSLAMIESVILLSGIIKNFSVHHTDSTEAFQPKSFVSQYPFPGLSMKFVRRSPELS